MARLWAYMAKEYNTAGSKEMFNGPTVKGPASKGYTSAGVENSDYLTLDVENQALNIQDVNNAFPIVSYGSNGGVRLMPVVGHQVAGQYSGKLYREQAALLLDATLRKKNSATNKTGDIPSFVIDRCYEDSDYEYGLISERFTGCKIGGLSLTVGTGSPVVQIGTQIVGSKFTKIPQATAGTPDYAKEPDCSSYPVNPFTFRHVSVYVDFGGVSLFPDKTGDWDVASLAAKRIKTIRSINLNFRNQLATSAHEEGIIERIQRTLSALSFSIVVDLMDPKGDPDTGTSTADNTATPKSTIWHKKYRDMRDSISGGYFSMAVVIDDGTKQIIFDLGKRTVQDNYTVITPIPDIFACQISGTTVFDPDNCGNGLAGFDWKIQDTPTPPAS